MITHIPIQTNFAARHQQCYSVIFTARSSLNTTLVCISVVLIVIRCNMEWGMVGFYFIKNHYHMAFLYMVAI